MNNTEIVSAITGIKSAYFHQENMDIALLILKKLKDVIRTPNKTSYVNVVKFYDNPNLGIALANGILKDNNMNIRISMEKYTTKCIHFKIIYE